jgi:5-methylcytosine-specific restriction endonuclease McrA
MTKAEYAEYLQSEHWKQLRTSKREACGKTSGKNRCAICGSTEQIETHHLNYRNIYDVVLSDLRLLCRQCHQAAHDLMAGGLRFKSKSHHGVFGALKSAVKKHRGFGNRNMFAG